MRTMFGMLESPDAARIGHAHTRIAMRNTAILAVRKYFGIVASFSANARITLHLPDPPAELYPDSPDRTFDFLDQT